MFELKEAISIWKQEAAKRVPEDSLEELEAHLLDAVDARIGEGMKAEDAFVLATHQLGNLGRVGGELARESGVPAPMGLPPLTTARRLRSALLFAGLALVILVMVQGLIDFLANQKFESQVVFEVRPEPSHVALSAFENTDVLRDMKPPNMDNAVEIIQSKKTLSNVVDSLRLDRRWDVGTTEAYERVRDAVQVHRLGQTDLVKVTVTGDEAQLSANIANAVASQYRDRKMSILLQLAGDALETLQRQLKDQSDKVEEARLRMLDLAERYRILPEDEQRISESLQRLAAEVENVQLAMLNAPNEIERDKLQRNLDLTNAMYEGRKDVSMDYQRKVAEYGEAKKEFQLQTEMLAKMQESFAKAQVQLTHPMVPIIVHEDAEPASNAIPRSAWWTAAMAGSWGWPLLIGASVLGWYLPGIRRKRREAELAEELLPASVTEEVPSWA